MKISVLLQDAANWLDKTAKKVKLWEYRKVYPGKIISNCHICPYPVVDGQERLHDGNSWVHHNCYWQRHNHGEYVDDKEWTWWKGIN